MYNVVLFSIFYAQFFFSEKMSQILRLDNADAEDEEQIQVRLIDRMAIRYVIISAVNNCLEKYLFLHFYCFSQSTFNSSKSNFGRRFQWQNALGYFQGKI